MRKTVLCFMMTLLLMLPSTGMVFASSGSSAYGDLDSNTADTTSLQLLYANLQLELSEIARDEAMERMNQISAAQEEQRQVSDFLNTARQLREEAVSTDQETEMPSDMAAYMDANGLAYDTAGGDLLMTGGEWDLAITSLEDQLMQLGSDTQQQMIYLQDWIGQYNSYLQGTNTQISESNQSLTNLARGQSMYGDSQAGLAVTSLVVGLVLGCVITLAAQKLRRKKDEA